jgi:tRNA(fMet)-specific endonuclease VapC
MRHPQGAVAARIAAVGEETICINIIVASELRFGAAKSGSKKLADRVDLILSCLEILPLEVPTDRYYGDIRRYLTLKGILIGPNDLLIAAYALSVGLTVVTANVGEFSRIPGLKVENWLENSV